MLTEILSAVFTLIVILGFFFLMLHVLKEHIGVGLLIGIVAAIIGYIWGPEGGLLLYGKWGFVGGVGLILLFNIKETFKLIIGGAIGFGIGSLINWPLHLSNEMKTNILLICILLGIALCSASAAASMSAGVNDLLTPRERAHTEDSDRGYIMDERGHSVNGRFDGDTFYGDDGNIYGYYSTFEGWRRK